MSNLNRWIEFYKRINAKRDPADFYNRIKSMYSEPERFYHTLEGHIAHCLDEFEPVKHLAEQPDELELALWLHDIICYPGGKGNEGRSAMFAYGLVTYMGLPQSFGSSVYDLILATDHKKKPVSVDGKLIVDIDLSILGQPEEVFDEYEENITKEYSDVIKELSEEEFKVGRIGILVGFLNKRPIYHTEFFRNKYENQAIKNLQRSIEKLWQ
jgi:predicted metal-dependent HD superfamily phosphohydrolase